MTNPNKEHTGTSPPHGSGQPHDMTDRATTLHAAGDQADPTDRPKARETRTFLLAVAILAALTLAMFGDVLFTGRAVLGDRRKDIVDHFIPRRQFGFDELRRGNLALWNPHIYSGVPLLGGFESAMLYPLHFLYLLVPVAPAINWTIAMHVFLGGVFMYLWAWHRGLHPAARLLAAVLMMFCGSHFVNIASGHLSNLAALIWAPLVLLSVDGLFRRQSLGWCLLGAFAVCMQILAGHPQYVFFTSVTVGLYTALRLVRARGRWRVAAGFGGMYLGGAALSAVQLLTGLDVAGQGIRSGGLPYSFASEYSLPPENLVALVVPGFFGNAAQFPYWGRWSYEEMTPFVGVTAVVLAVCGAVLARREVRRFSAAMILICMVLALGKYTPLHRLLCDHVPLFGSVRAISRFAFQASLFIAMLAGAGLDELIRRRHALRKAAIGVSLAALAAGAAALAVRASALSGLGGWWHEFLHGTWATGECAEMRKLFGDTVYDNTEFVRDSGLFAAKWLLAAAGTGLLLAVLLLGVRRFTRLAVLGMVLLAGVEVFAAARLSRLTVAYAGPRLRMEDVDPAVQAVESFLAGREGNYRIHNQVNPNAAIDTHRADIWGFDAFPTKRYVELMAFMQGIDLDEAEEEIGIARPHPLFRMLRLRFVFEPDDDGVRALELPDPLGRLELIRDCRVIEGRDSILAAMDAEDFDPRRTVILETPPAPWPETFAEGGSARVVDSSTDHLTVEADVPAAAILLITDTYAAGWRAVALPGSVQQTYQLMSANYALRAVPLKAGKHRLRVEYAPPAFRAGVWISAVSVAVYLALLGWHVRRRAGTGV